MWRVFGPILDRSTAARIDRPIRRWISVPRESVCPIRGQSFDCHGATAQGGLGPSWIGLSGSTVQLNDGTQVTADDAYIAESIRMPSAKRVAGYSIAMPPTHLSDSEVGALVAYIDSLAATTGG